MASRGKLFEIGAKIVAVDRITRPMRAITGRLRRMWLSVRAMSDHVGFTRLLRGLRRVGVGIIRVTRRAARLGVLLAGIGLGLAGISATKAITDFSKWGDTTAKLAKRLDVSTSALQRFQFAADREGVSESQFNSLIDAMSKRMGELKAGTGALHTLLKKTAPEFAKQLKGVKSNEEAFRLLVKAISRLEDPQKRAALVAAAFSRQGLKLLNLFALGEKGLKAYREELEKYGGVVSKKALRNAEDFNDSQTNLGRAWRSMQGVLAERLLPTLTKFVNRLAEWVGQNKELIATKLDAFIKRVGKFLSEVDFGKILKGIGDTLDRVDRLVKAIGGWKTAAIGLGAILAGPLLAALVGVVAMVGKLGILLAANPIGLLIIAIGGLAYVVATNWTAIKRETRAMADDVGTTLGGLGEAFAGLASGDLARAAKGFEKFTEGGRRTLNRFQKWSLGWIKNFAGPIGPAIAAEFGKVKWGDAFAKGLADLTTKAKEWFAGFKAWITSAIGWIKRQFAGLSRLAHNAMNPAQWLGKRLGIIPDGDKPSAAPAKPDPGKRSSLIKPSNTPAAANPNRLEGTARAEVNVKMQPTEDFWAKVDTRIQRTKAIDLGVSTGKQFPARAN